MKNKTSMILYGIAVVGAFLVGQGIMTGEELTSIQNIVGLVLGGTGLTAGTLLLVVKAIPEQAIIWLFKKAGDKYGQEAVDGLLQTFKDIQTAQVELNNKIDAVIKTQEEDRETRNNLLNE